MYDIFFLNYHEPMADINWKILSGSQPHARRLPPVDGILAAHYNCAKMSRTSNFFVVDADNEVINVDFRIKLSEWDRNYVHVWRSKNPVNNLTYGWGGVKLFPKKLLLETDRMPIDMTTSFPLKIVNVVGSITHFNTSPFDTWRSSFRECVKLSKNDDQESQERLNVWCSVANGQYAEWCLKGANSGREFGFKHRNVPDMLKSINDWMWLRERFEDEKDN